MRELNILDNIFIFQLRLFQTLLKNQQDQRDQKDQKEVKEVKEVTDSIEAKEESEVKEDVASPSNVLNSAPATHSDTGSVRAESGSQPVPAKSQSESLITAEHLDSLERATAQAAHDLANLMASLQSSMHTMTGLSLQCMTALKLSTDNVSDAVGEAVVQMHDFLTKVQQLDRDVKPVYTLSNQIKDIKKALDTFEHNLHKMEKRIQTNKT